MNVYDFDKTIYDGDSSVDFFLYCLKRKPMLARYILKQGAGVILHMLGLINKEKMKEYFFSFLRSLDNIEAEVHKFWDKNERKIKRFYLEQRKDDDVIISASPDFLLKEIARRLHIRCLIATKMSPEKIKVDGKNCKGDEKINRFFEVFGEQKIEKFYSDSLTDIPLCRISEIAYHVKKDKIEKWDTF